MSSQYLLSRLSFGRWWIDFYITESYYTRLISIYTQGLVDSRLHHLIFFAISFVCLQFAYLAIVLVGARSRNFACLQFARSSRYGNSLRSAANWSISEICLKPFRIATFLFGVSIVLVLLLHSRALRVKILRTFTAFALLYVDFCDVHGSKRELLLRAHLIHSFCSALTALCNAPFIYVGVLGLAFFCKFFSCCFRSFYCYFLSKFRRKSRYF